jgi:broad specificity phosphatase PhoE
VTWAPPGGESLADLGARVRAACGDLVDAAREGDVIVVSHVSPLKAAVAWVLGVGDEVAWRLHLSTGSVTRAAIREHAPVLLSFDEVAHLS